MKQAFKFIIVLALLLNTKNVYPQDSVFIKKQVANLSGKSMLGRGYVSNGRERAAQYIKKQLLDLGITGIHNSKEFFQPYSFSVNTFPNRMRINLKDYELKPGVDYIVHPAATGITIEKAKKFKTIKTNKIKDSLDWVNATRKIKKGGYYLLPNVDSLKKFSKLNTKDFYRSLPTATYITGQQSKLIWSVATDTMSHTIVQMKDSTLNGLKGKKIALDIQNKLDKKALNKNVIAWIPSSVQSDSTIVFCAHYDHLGKMGHKTIFYGANDNASGSGFLIGLGKYFSENPSKYNIALIFFSGEEAGLLGSKYFTENPTFPLDKIKLVWNIDLMGDATDGITVVNGNEQKSFVESIQAINQSQKYLPKILSRDNAPNSDHYPFIQKGVPAIFTYANGGKGHYHDIYDEYKTLSFKNIFQVFKLITNWVQEEEKKSFF